MSGYQELCICRMADLCSAKRPVFVYPSDELPRMPFWETVRKGLVRVHSVVPRVAEKALF
jgi:hypothetical protein